MIASLWFLIPWMAFALLALISKWFFQQNMEKSFNSHNRHFDPFTGTFGFSF